MQLDFFNSTMDLQIVERLAKLETTLNKTRRSLFARINELEREVLELRREEDEEEEKILKEGK